MFDIKEQSLNDARPVQKWGDAAIAGWQALPDVLLKYQYRLKLNPTEMMVLLNVLSYWWYVETLPFPRVSTIAKRMDVTPRTVQRALTKLYQRKLLIKKKHQTSNNEEREVYDPAPLVKVLEALAKNDRDFQSRQNKEGIDVREVPF